MNLWNLSLAYLRRQKVKTTTLFIVFFSIGACLISLTSVQHSLENNVLNQQERSLYLSSKNQGFWPKEAYEAIKKAKVIESVEASVSADVATDLAFSKDSQLANSEKTVQLVGFSDVKNIQAFQKQDLQLEKGQMLSEDNPKQVLVPSKLAQVNHLKVGDSLTLGKKEVTIAGIYKSNLKQDSPQHANTVIASAELVQSISGQSGYHSMSVVLKQKQLVESVAQNIKQWGLDWSKLDVQTAKEFHGDAYRNIETLHQLVQRMNTMLSVLAVAVLVLMLTFWMNSRIRETGILLSIGKSKLEVIMHYLIEVLVVAAIAFVFSIIGGMFLGQILGEGLLSQVNGGIASRAAQGNFMADSLEHFSISVGIMDILSLYVQGALICLVAVSLSSYSILRLQPKQILSRMS